MGELTRTLGVMVIACGVLACGTEARHQKSDASRANPDALVLKDFNDRVAAYVKLRKNLKSDATALKETKEPARIRASGA